MISSSINISKCICLFWLTVISCTQPNKSKKLIVLNVRGLSFEYLKTYTDQHKDSYFNQLLSSKRIKAIRPVNNAVTAVNRASFETGALPSEHGIIGHLFGKKGNTIHSVSGFTEPFEKEAYWENIAGKGIKTAYIGALATHGKNKINPNTVILAQAEPSTDYQLLRLKFSNEFKTVSRVVRQRQLQFMDNQKQIQIAATSVYLYAIDSIENKKTTIVLDKDDNPSNGWLSSGKTGDWLEMEINRDQQLPIKATIHLRSQADSLFLFVRPFFIPKGYPEIFLQTLNQKTGPPKGWPTFQAYFKKDITEQTIQEEIQMELGYLMGAFKKVVEEDFKLITLDYPLLDRIGHLFSPVDPLRTEFHDENGKKQHRYQQLLQDAYQQLENNLKQIEAVAKKNNFELLIVSGHGFTPIHTAINLTALLYKAVPDIAKDSLITIIAGKVSANLYIPKNKWNNISQIKQTLLNSRDHRTGELIFDTVLYKQELNPLGLQHPNTGDLWVICKPGYVFQNDSSAKGNIFLQPDFRGDHGYLNRYPETWGVLLVPQHLSSSIAPMLDITSVSSLIKKILLN